MRHAAVAARAAAGAESAPGGGRPIAWGADDSTEPHDRTATAGIMGASGTRAPRLTRSSSPQCSSICWRCEGDEREVGPNGSPWIARSCGPGRRGARGRIDHAEAAARAAAGAESAPGGGRPHRLGADESTQRHDRTATAGIVEAFWHTSAAHRPIIIARMQLHLLGMRRGRAKAGDERISPDDRSLRLRKTRCARTHRPRVEDGGAGERAAMEGVDAALQEPNSRAELKLQFTWLRRDVQGRSGGWAGRPRRLHSPHRNNRQLHREVSRGT